MLVDPFSLFEFIVINTRGSKACFLHRLKYQNNLCSFFSFFFFGLNENSFRIEHVHWVFGAFSICCGDSIDVVKLKMTCHHTTIYKFLSTLCKMLDLLSTYSQPKFISRKLWRRIEFALHEIKNVFPGFEYKERREKKIVRIFFSFIPK